MDTEVMFSSEKHDWETPWELFCDLDKEFNFTLDACATSDNAKCNRFFTKEIDGLEQDWSGETVFVNPPYGRQIHKWVKKAYEEGSNGATVVMLIPARTDTSYWHDYIFGKAEIRFLRGRVKFSGKGSAPFPSAVVVFHSKYFDKANEIAKKWKDKPKWKQDISLTGRNAND